MKKIVEFRQYFGNIICNLAVNLAGLRKCLPEYHVHNLVTLLGLAYHIGVIEHCCQMVQYYTIFYKKHFLQKWCNFTCLCVRKISCDAIEKLVQFGVISKIFLNLIR